MKARFVFVLALVALCLISEATLNDKMSVGCTRLSENRVDDPDYILGAGFLDHECKIKIFEYKKRVKCTAKFERGWWEAVYFWGKGGLNATIYSFSDPCCEQDKKKLQDINAGQCLYDPRGQQITSLWDWQPVKK